LDISINYKVQMTRYEFDLCFVNQAVVVIAIKIEL